ncbi:hypothetical protein HPB51_004871 [Rhipicephalus microplus]|uniref:RING-type domain-containing protein n=1 Tax=Rhipicephalus microplus TaxID=6941 RepID=A0A9J6E692_RHIMP|nr:hypothetical protein HPB51_004871 [Rhipicephalus microplus]
MSQPVASALHRVCDTVSGVNWRPTRFVDELVVTRYACHLCRVIPSTTVVLPCAHGLCELCHAGSPLEDGRRVCPLDGKSFGEWDYEKCHLLVLKKDLEAYCWNEEHGCNFVGPLVKVLQHFEQECTFHAFPCLRCGENVLRGKLSEHYAGECKSLPVMTGEGGETPRPAQVPPAESSNVTLALRSKGNELAEQSRIVANQLRMFRTELTSTQETSDDFAEATEEAWRMQESACNVPKGRDTSRVPGAEAHSIVPESLLQMMRRMSHRLLSRDRSTVVCAGGLKCVHPSVFRPVLHLFPGPVWNDASPVDVDGTDMEYKCGGAPLDIYHMCLTHIDNVSRLSTFHDCYRMAPDSLRVSVVVVNEPESETSVLNVRMEWDYAPGRRRSFPKVVRVAILMSDGCLDLVKCGESGGIISIFNTPNWKKGYKNEGYLTFMVVIDPS